MKKIRKTIEIKAPVQRVFDFLAQPSNLPTIWPNMVAVSNAVPRMAGLHDFDWEFRMVGFHFTGHTRILEAQAGKFARLQTSGGIPSTFVFTYQGLDGSGTRLTVDVEYEIPTPIIGKLAEAIVAKMNERDIETMLGHLKDVMEVGTVSAATGVAARPH